MASQSFSYRTLGVLNYLVMPYTFKAVDIYFVTKNNLLIFSYFHCHGKIMIEQIPYIFFDNIYSDLHLVIIFLSFSASDLRPVVFILYM